MLFSLILVVDTFLTFRLNMIKRLTDDAANLAIWSHNQAWGYFDSLEKEQKGPIVAIIKTISKDGLPKNTEKYRQLEGELYEIKKGQHRFTCYSTNINRTNTLVLLHGFKKQTGRTPKKEIKHGLVLMQAVEEFIRQGGIENEHSR